MATRFFCVAFFVFLTCSLEVCGKPDSLIIPTCTPIGVRCIPNTCCPGSRCESVPNSRTGVCQRKPSTCAPNGEKCNKKMKCCSIRDTCAIQDKRGNTGVCTNQRCAPTGANCLTRTPSYTGPEFPCCSSKETCLFLKPGSISGTCLPKSSDTTCFQEGAQCSVRGKKSCCKGLECDAFNSLPFSIGFCRKPKKCISSGEACTDGGNACCPSLDCTSVVQGARPPDGVLPRICFDENCSIDDCSKGQLCCPGWGCGTSNGRKICIPFPSVRSPIIGSPL